MLPPILRPGDVIGLASPSWLATGESTAPAVSALEALGYGVRLAPQIFARGWDYAASPEERAESFNALIRDPEVRLVFFGGGEGADDIVPLLDYEAAGRNPKLYLSYSDGTSILNAIHAKTGLVTLYGQTPGRMPENLEKPMEYNLKQFAAFNASRPGCHTAAGPWRTLVPGRAEGMLAGGYLANTIFAAATGQLVPEGAGDLVLFVEDHAMFNGIEALSAHIGRLEQCGIMPRVRGLLFGHYSVPVNEQLLARLARLGERWGIPVAYCDDFGHGENSAILPIGVRAALDTGKCTLEYDWLDIPGSLR